MNTNYPFDPMPHQPTQDPLSSGVADDEEQYVEFTLMMSLALDGLLDQEQEEQFQADLARYPLLAEQWQLWQELDGMLHKTPAVAPPADFTQKFEARLAQHERRRRLWLGVTVAVLSVLMWTSILAGALSVGAYVLTNQGNWLTQFVHSTAYTFSVISLWFGTATETATTVLNTPQAWGIAVAYLALMITILTFWTQFLRRSTQPISAS